MERPVSQGYSWATESIKWVQHPHDLRLAVMRGNKFPDWRSEWSLLLSEAKNIPMKVWFYGWCCPDLEEAKGFMEALSPSRRWEKFQRVVCVCVQLCLTLCDPMYCSPPGSSVHRISQARILEWVSIPFSRGSLWLRDQTWVSCIGRQIYHQRHLEGPSKR